MATPIRDAVVAITGASSGIGRAAALRFAERGANLVLVARRQRALQELEQECRQRGGNAFSMGADVADEGALRQLVTQAVETYGRIDAWINNAGVLAVGKFEDLPSNVYRRVLETNLFGYINGARAVLPLFRRQGRGTLVNVASLGGKVAMPYQSPYNASKFAIVGWSASLRMELRLDEARGIHVCTVLPAFVDTPLFQHAANYSGRAVKPVRPAYSADKVAAALLRAVRHPQREIVVGASARLAMMTHAVAPGLTERMACELVERDHLAARPAAHSDGNVMGAADGHTTVSGGWRESEPPRNRVPTAKTGH
jgi:short-subunit dehydrogenase